jgi:hypothetical protein
MILLENVNKSRTSANNLSLNIALFEANTSDEGGRSEHLFNYNNVIDNFFFLGAFAQTS